MKAVLIGPAHPFKGGIANFNESLAIAFIKNSIETEIISYRYKYFSFFINGHRLHKDKKPSYSLKIKSLIFIINPISWIKTAHYLKQISPDLLVVQFWTPYLAPIIGTIIRLSCIRNNSKIIGIMHNVLLHESRWIDKIFLKYFVSVCNGFICLSKSALIQLNSITSNPNKLFSPHPIYDIFGEKITKIEARKFLNLSVNAKVLLFFGIIRKYKGLELLLRALAHEKVREWNVTLLVAGEFYEDRQYYFKLVESLNIKDNVIFTDKFIPNDLVKYYFCAADMIVQPYLSATQSGVTQVAYNFERPMLVTNVGGLSEIVIHGKTGYVTNVDAEAIALAIDDFYTNEREEEMSANVQVEQYRFSWHSMVDAILQLTDKVK